MTKIVDQFNSSKVARSEKIVVEITRAGGSGALAGQLSAEALTKVQNMADIFICADSNRMSDLIDEAAIVETFPIATQFPIIAIRATNDSDSDLLQVVDLRSLLDLKVKLGIGSATSAIGFETRRIATSHQCLDLLQTRKTADFENVMSLAQALSIGSVDAAIVWDSTTQQFNQADNQAIEILAYLESGTAGSESTLLNTQENGSSAEENFSPAAGFGKFSIDKAANAKRFGCFIEVGRSISTNPQADLFFGYLKSNRERLSSDFVDAGFSSLSLESSFDNGRESNQP